MKLWLSRRISSVLPDAFLDVLLEDLKLLDPDTCFVLGDVVKSSKHFVFIALVHDSQQPGRNIVFVLPMSSVDGIL